MNISQLSQWHLSRQYLSLRHLSISGISQLLVPRIWPNFKGRFLGPSWPDSILSWWYLPRQHLSWQHLSISAISQLLITCKYPPPHHPQKLNFRNTSANNFFLPKNFFSQKKMFLTKKIFLQKILFLPNKSFFAKKNLLRYYGHWVSVGGGVVGIYRWLTAAILLIWTNDVWTNVTMTAWIWARLSQEPTFKVCLKWGE